MKPSFSVRRTLQVMLLLVAFFAVGLIAREAAALENRPSFSIAHATPLFYPLGALPMLHALFLP
jgi:hypothetical protein